jgi:hypothetical protein
MIELT